jgi:general secretion pathway protein D
VAVQTGSTVALGGLIRDNISKGKDGVPFLKDIPGLGAAFRSTNNTQRRTELLVFITPRIIRNTDEAKEMTDYLRGKLQGATQVMDGKKRR